MSGYGRIKVFVCMLYFTGGGRKGDPEGGIKCGEKGGGEGRRGDPRRSTSTRILNLWRLLATECTDKLL